MQIKSFFKKIVRFIAPKALFVNNFKYPFKVWKKNPFQFYLIIFKKLAIKIAVYKY